MFALYPRVRGIAAAVLAIVAGIALSGTMEAVQNFLPTRVPSNLDLLTNVAGACIGAFAGAASDAARFSNRAACCIAPALVRRTMPAAA